MAIKPAEETKPAGAGAEGSSTRTSELDLTKRSTGPVWRQYLRAMGPGLVTGASTTTPRDCHLRPGRGQIRPLVLWTALLTLPLMVGVQEICDRTALATGTGLGELAVKRFQRAGRSILAVLSCGPHRGQRIEHRRRPGRHRIWYAAPPCRTDLALGAGRGRPHHHAACSRLLRPHRPRLQGFCAPRFCPISSLPSSSPISGAVCSATPIVPHVEFNKAYLALLVAVLGTTISPYLFFWQSAHRLEEMRDEPEGGTKAIPLKQQSSERPNASSPPAASTCLPG